MKKIRKYKDPYIFYLDGNYENKTLYQYYEENKKP